jgi:hypothetical protein
MIKVYFNADIFFLMTNNKQMLGNEFKGIANDAGIIYIISVIYTLEQNGLAEQSGALLIT